ncbi:MAG: HAD-IC family P-type ATPase [Burkholderiaceae bacterium]|nr:HAD-IC family P-type ATPase [Burkholderiaceae bacterium]
MRAGTLSHDRPAAAPADAIPLHAWHSLPTTEALTALDGAPDGLSADEVRARLAQHGRNELPPPPRRSAWMRFLLQFHNLLIYTLIAAGVVTLLLAHYVDSAVIFGVVIVNAIIGFIQEGKAERALEAVSAMLASHAIVLRDGTRHEIEAAELVPGDIVLLASGDKVPADLRLLKARNLQIDEAALTGESMPVSKTAASRSAEAVTPRPPRHGLHGHRGRVRAGRVVSRSATGSRTEIGRIGALPSAERGSRHAAAHTPARPASQRLLAAVHAYWRGADASCSATCVRGQAGHRCSSRSSPLAVAAIPEGLPAIVTITLAIGNSACRARNTFVRRLQAVETLGNATVICSDKTGTLTQNQIDGGARTMLGTRKVTVSRRGIRSEGRFRVGRTAPGGRHPTLSRNVLGG